MDLRREMQPAEILIVGEGRLQQRVAENRRVDPGADRCDMIIGADGPDITMIAEREGHFDIGAGGFGLGAIGQRGFQKALRRRPYFGDALFDRGRSGGRDRRGAGRGALRRRDVPGRVAEHAPFELLLHRRGPRASVRRLAARELHAFARLVEVDRGAIGGDVELRPVAAGDGRLAELAPMTGAGKFQGLDSGRPTASVAASCSEAACAAPAKARAQTPRPAKIRTVDFGMNNLSSWIKHFAARRTRPHRRSARRRWAKDEG